MKFSAGQRGCGSQMNPKRNQPVRQCMHAMQWWIALVSPFEIRSVHPLKSRHVGDKIST